MRTTLDIDSDILKAAKSMARRTRRSAGAVLSDLARQTLGAPRRSSENKSRRHRSVGGFAPFPSRGGVVTNELIDRLRDSDVY